MEAAAEIRFADPIQQRDSAQVARSVRTDVGQNSLQFQQEEARRAEQQLLVRLRAGDRAAFAQWVQQHQRPLFAVVWRYVKNDQDAQDVVQAAFVRAWQGLPNFRADASLRTWLYRIAVNLALNHKRDARGHATVEIPEHAPSADQHPVERMAEGEMHDRLLAAVDKLPQKQRLVVELRVQQALSFREVADVVESTEDSAKANFHHAIKRLRTMLMENDRDTHV